MNRHYRAILPANSPVAGQICPVSREVLQAGQEIIICTATETGFSVEGWKEIDGKCPFCTGNDTEAPLPPPPTIAPAPRPLTSSAWLVTPDRHSVPLDRDVFNIGRGESNHLVLNDSFVSQDHARIRRAGKVFYLFDLASSNGVWVNGRRVYRLLLRDGDKIQLGNTILVFKQTPQERISTGTRGSKRDTQPLYIRRKL